jgi:hypothetical protein
MEDQAMKKLSVLLILVISALMLRAEGKATSYVTVGDQIYFCETVKPGLLNMNLAKEDGTIVKVPIKKVDSYSSNGRMFERLPVICNGTPTKCTALMEYITSRNGFRLYKHCEYGECGNLWDNTYKKTHLQVEYYVYKDGKFYLPVNKENAASILPFFGIEVIL